MCPLHRRGLGVRQGSSRPRGIRETWQVPRQGRAKHACEAGRLDAGPDAAHPANKDGMARGESPARPATTGISCHPPLPLSADFRGLDRCIDQGMPHQPRLARPPFPSTHEDTVTLPATTDDLPAPIEGLTDMQSAFVREYVANGGKAGAAAKAAGYAPKSAAVTASRMLTQPAVIQAIFAESVQALGRHLPAAVGRIARLSQRAKSEYVQFEASKDILDRVGLAAPKQHRHQGSINVSFDLG
jgi:hypothetical protein